MVEVLRSDHPAKATDHLGHPGVIEAFLVGWSQVWLGQGVGDGSLEWMDPVAAARLPAALLGVLTCVVLFRWGRRLWGSNAALFAALFLALEPSHVALSRLAHLDGPLTFFYLATVLAFAVGTLERDWRWQVAAGVLLGGALATKAPAFLLPGALLVWKVASWVRSGEMRRAAPVTAGDVAVMMLGYLTYLALFAKLWHTPENARWIAAAAEYPLYDVARGAGLLLRRVPLAEGALALLAAARWIAWRRSGERRRVGDLFAPRAAVWHWLGLAVACLLVVRLFPTAVENTFLVLRRLGGHGTGGEEQREGTPLGSMQGPLFFYPLVLAVRLPEVLVAAVLAGLVLTVWRYATGRGAAAAAAPLVAGLGFIAMMSPARRVAMRYIAPAMPFLCVLGGLGLAAAGDSVSRVLNRRRVVFGRPAAAAACALLAVGTGLPILAVYFPNTYLYHNSFIGGPRGAAEHMLVGWGEGYKEITAALKNIAVKDDVNVTVLGHCSPIRYYWLHDPPRNPVRANIASRTFDEADYVVLVLSVLQRNPRARSAAFAWGRKPLYVLNLQGVDIAWIYAHDRVVAPVEEKYRAADRVFDARPACREKDPAAKDRKTVVGRAGRDPEGWLLRGPYRTHAPGGYKAVFRVRTDSDAADGEIARLEVAADDGGQVLGSATGAGRDFVRLGVYQDFVVPFRLDAQKPLEFRVFFRGASNLWVYEIRTQP
jgi:4-amino-4-deoxy-L-arabinose transferase-like glycosyltransferase